MALQAGDVMANKGDTPEAAAAGKSARCKSDAADTAAAGGSNNHANSARTQPATNAAAATVTTAGGGSGSGVTGKAISNVSKNREQFLC